MTVIPILDLMDDCGIKDVTFEAHKFQEEYKLCVDDKDWVTFHKTENPPFTVDKLIGLSDKNMDIGNIRMFCDYETTPNPIYKDWYMTINYHS